MKPRSVPTRPGHPGLAIVAVCLASAAMPMTFTGPAVALRDIAASLGGSPQALAWVTNAFMLVFGSSLMMAGALADRHGRRRVFLAGIAVFVTTSLALMAAPSLWVFDLLRGVQGAASAAVFAGGAAALAQEFDGAARLRAFSFLGTGFGLGLTLGPVAAGWLTASFGWRAIFVLVIACAGIAFLIGITALRESRDPSPHPLDWAGAISFTLALTVFTCGVLQAPALGWTHPLMLLAWAGSALLLAGFVRLERRSPAPVLDLSLFRYPRFVGVQFLAAAPAYGYVVLLVMLPVRFIGIEGLSVARTGLWMMALSLPLVLLPTWAGRLARRFSPALLCGAGLLVAAAGLVGLALCSGGASALLPMAVIGIGMSLPWGLMDGLAVSVVPRERAGMATGIFSTTRVAGEGLAVAVVAALLAVLIAHRLAADAGMTPAAATALAQRLVAGDLSSTRLPTQAMVQAYQAGFSALAWILAGVTTVTAAIVFGVLGRDDPIETRAAEPVNA